MTVNNFGAEMYKKQIRVAILMAAYNGESYIVEQLESIFAQSDVSVCVFVSLDKSTDSTYNILKTYGDEGKIQLLSYGQVYGSAGKNFFRLIVDVDFSDFDYVSFSDQDDIWHEDKLINGISRLKNSESQGYSSNVEAFWPDGRTALISKDQKQKKYDYLFESCGPGCTFLLQNKLAAAIKSYLLQNPEYYEDLWLHDWFIYAFSRSNGYKWVIDSYPSLRYRQHGDNEVGANFGIKAITYRLKVILSGDGFDKVMAQALFLGQGNKLPIRYLKDRSRFSFFKLGLTSYHCRRSTTDCFYFFIVCFYFVITGKW